MFRETATTLLFGYVMSDDDCKFIGYSVITIQLAKIL